MIKVEFIENNDNVESWDISYLGKNIRSIKKSINTMLYYKDCVANIVIDGKVAFTKVFQQENSSNWKAVKETTPVVGETTPVVEETNPVVEELIKFKDGRYLVTQMLLKKDNDWFSNIFTVSNEKIKDIKNFCNEFMSNVEGYAYVVSVKDGVGHIEYDCCYKGEGKHPKWKIKKFNSQEHF
jgi:hypothetical protein